MDTTRTDVRRWFPALAEGPAGGLARFDAPGGSLVPEQVSRAIAEAMRLGMCQRGTLTAPERAAEATTADARDSMGWLLGADPRGIILGRSMTALTFEMSRTLSASWGPGDEVLVTRLDHDANIRPWVIAAERAGATVRWLEFDPETTELDDVGPQLSERTKVVAVTAASNLLGTRTDVPAIAAAAHEVGALVYVDAVHLAAHAPVDLGALGADVVACSPYKFFGPHLGVLAADPAFLETLSPDKLLPSSDQVPERFELGTLPYELLAGVSAAASFIDDDLGGMAAVESHETRLLERLLDGLAGDNGLPDVRVHGSPEARTPTLLLTHRDHSPAEVSKALAERGVIAPAGSFYALEASRHLGLGDQGGVRIGLSACSNDDDVDRLLTGLAALT